jgi:hypothetical protein
MPRKDLEARREYNRQWREKNPDKVKANSDRSAPTQRAYRKAHLAEYAEYQRKDRAKNPRVHLVNQAKTRARRDGLPFDISVETMYWPTHCPVLGVELSYNKEPKVRRENWQVRSATATLDRHINELGYVLGNVNVISHRANRIKTDATPLELSLVAKYAGS